MVYTNISFEEIIRRSTDGNGQLVIKDYSLNSASNTNSVTDTAPALFTTAKTTLQNAITSTATGAAVDASKYSKHSFFVSLTTSGTILLQASYDNSTWFTLADDAYGNDISSGVTTAGVHQVEGKFPYLRANVTAVSGALTVNYFGGN